MPAAVFWAAAAASAPGPAAARACACGAAPPFFFAGFLPFFELGLGAPPMLLRTKG